jgi:hypothetical protein
VEVVLRNIIGVLEDGERERIIEEHKEDEGLDFDKGEE